MANSNDKEKKETTQLQEKMSNTPNSLKQKKSEASGAKSNGLIAKTALIIAILAVATTFYNQHEAKKIQSRLVDENKSMMAQLKNFAQNQDTAQEQFTAIEKSILKKQKTLHYRMDGLNKELRTAIKQRLYQNQDWLLLKAQYYLELAQINTHWSDNFNTSIALLQQADALLSQINTPQIFAVRQIIAKEIAQLKATPIQDIPGLLSKLDAAQISVSNLTIQSPLEKNQLSATKNDLDSSRFATWKAQFKNSLKSLEQLVIVRRTDENITPLMSPLFESALKETIRLNLQQAQWAILHKNNAVYQLALQQACNAIKRVFDTKAQDTAALLHQLTELQNIKFIQEQPEIGTALPQLHQIIEDNELHNAPINNSEKGVN
ncbi:uroporphyrinogen-III C-methyltransferase [Legionella worsleiensis]|uniref:Uroporphyrinogen III methylase n=1 Tax=Legionella worsleiensis TaxID=45076 RepID=A0A0W1AJX9_9GAMM|nr:uroporphyrinogen-III C-methyltransferase [Legionella worsleiensis]KTD81659.1 uroporphyrinogen III methylase [Legionella worsleiensis]STY31931.1 uroporphyrin-III C-methyltransferase [Legionella worsleiensis]